jgi:2',3'-cyclic-nucleotide 2'-phosphodiesterase (5'-nucleotidase family)
MRQARWLPLLLLLLVTEAAFGSGFTVLYTNDLHARLERLESLGRLIEAERSQGEPILLLDAGDTWQDFRAPLPAVWGAEEMVAWMNRVGYSAMALGNHDLYFGAERFASLAGQAGFPIVCANLVPLAGLAAPFLPSTIALCDGLRVLIVGLVTGEFLPYADLPWLRYVDPAVALASTLRASAAQPPDVVIALCHLSVDEARRLAEAVPGVDLFVTGHSHEATREPVRAGHAWIVQADAFGQTLGRLRLEVDPDVPDVRVAANTLLRTETTLVERDQGGLRLIEVALLLASVLLLFFVV